MAEIRCPECGSTDVICFDGNGGLSEYGCEVMTDIAPEMYRCGNCGEIFRIDTDSFFESDFKGEDTE